jgi:uncharacterized protein (TIGR02001 family)
MSAPLARRCALPCLLSLALVAPVQANSLSSTFTLASDYLFDGVSQTQNDPAFQAGLDYGVGGFYAGLWTSNVDFGPGDPADQEIDLYAGYGQSYDNGWGWSAGFAHYTYSGAKDYRYTEWTASLTLPTATTLQLWVADDATLGGESWRLKGKHSLELAHGFALNFEDYNHLQLGVSRSFGPIDTYLGYSDTSKDINQHLADGRVLLTLSTTVDWLK